ncbi:flavodoxin family protein [Lactiplantibacillus fabifermentans]|uniref:Flavodoxin n=2 Tax=Lactiplantibacillus fabifermentans TaxID=483011 RepID=A0A0R2NNP4_9LACO|nr:flavodoxin [Lactiplantibacillus fabifermentans]ETY74001.1 flavodoxin [Lactiplantibacillus fabifermentans T30PCM01]KRO27361.1 flavodoxin [Lactiplantibacillus fabifermentans DSM 21115]
MTLPKGRGARSDGADTNQNQMPVRRLTPAATTLVIYFSRSGNTEAQAQLAAQTLGADEYELVVQNPYPANYAASVSRATAEREAATWPELRLTDLPDLRQYQLILLGHPIWAMTPANPMRRFLQVAGSQLANKAVASFSTNAGYGAGDTQTVLQRLTPNSTQILPNYTIHDINLENTTGAFKHWLQQTKEFL